MKGCACCPSGHLSTNSRGFYRERFLPSQTPHTQLVSSSPVRSRCGHDPLPQPTTLQCYGGRTPGMMSRSPTSSSMFPRSSLPVDDSPEMKPRIWSIADVATSRPNDRHSFTSGHVTLTADGSGSGVASAVDVTGNGWTSNAAFHDVTAPRLTATAAITSFPPRIRPLPVGGREDGSGESAISGLSGLQRIPSSCQQHSCRMTTEPTTGQLE